jgi:hypothetical protein
MVRDLLLTSMRGVAMAYTFTDVDPVADRHMAIWLDIAELLLETP